MLLFQSNTTITRLDLSDNWLGSKGGLSVCEMLKENCYITHVVIGSSMRFVCVLFVYYNVVLLHTCLSEE